MTPFNKEALTAAVQSFPARVEAKPATTGPAPHRQADQFPDSSSLEASLLAHVKTFPGIVVGESHISGDGGYLAFFLPQYAGLSGASQHFLIDNEFAHIHEHKSISLHAVLPPEIGAVVAEKKWGEQHPLAAYRITTTANYMLFGARDEAENEQLKTLLSISYMYANGMW